MKEAFRNLIQLESIMEETAKDCSKEFKSFYMGLIKGLKEARWILINEIKKDFKGEK